MLLPALLRLDVGVVASAQSGFAGLSPRVRPPDGTDGPGLYAASVLVIVLVLVLEPCSWLLKGVT